MCEDHKWYDAARDGQRRRIKGPWDVYTCLGYHGVRCPRWAFLAKHDRCGPCRVEFAKPAPVQVPEPGQQHPETTQHAVQLAEITSERPESTQHAVQLPEIVSEHDADCLKAAQLCAETISRLGEKGFKHLVDSRPGAALQSPAYRGPILHWNVLQRLALIADTTLIPKVQRKQASHCGGVAPDDRYKALSPLKGTRFCADGGNNVYFYIVENLLCKCEDLTAMAPKSMKSRIQNLQGMAAEYRGDVVETALAAAEYAHRVEHAKPITWKWLIGGAYATGDLPI